MSKQEGRTGVGKMFSIINNNLETKHNINDVSNDTSRTKNVSWL